MKSGSFLFISHEKWPKAHFLPTFENIFGHKILRIYVKNMPFGQKPTFSLI